MDVHKSPKFYGVEILRFIAAFLVVLTHSTFYAHERNDPTMPIWHAGEAGVHIFFVISGFVIVLASRRPDGWVSAADFVSRRFLRIMPMYWLVTSLNVAILLAMPSLVLHSSLDWGQIARSYLLIPDVNSAGVIEPLVGVAWTLYFESFFYVVFGLALLLTVNPFAFVPAVLAVFVGLSFFRTEDWPHISVYANPIILEFLAGMILAANVHRMALSRVASILIMAAGMVMLITLDEFRGDLPSVVYGGIPSLIIVIGMVASERFIDWSRFRWMLYLGGASYAIYLFHPMISPAAPVILTKIGILNGELSTFLSVAFAVAIPTAIHAVIERPLMKVLASKRRNAIPA